MAGCEGQNRGGTITPVIVMPPQRSGMPLGKLDRYVVRAPQENELSGMKVQNSGALSKSRFLHAPDEALDVIDSEAYVVEPDSAEIPDVPVRHRIGMEELQQLHLRTRTDALGHERDMPGLDFRHAHILGKTFALDYDRGLLAEAEQSKEPLRFLLVLDNERHMVKALDHGNFPPD
jgi:hypothetical protein